MDVSMEPSQLVEWTKRCHEEATRVVQDKLALEEAKEQLVQENHELANGLHEKTAQLKQAQETLKGRDAALRDQDTLLKSYRDSAEADKVQLAAAMERVAVLEKEKEALKHEAEESRVASVNKDKVLEIREKELRQRESQVEVREKELNFKICAHENTLQQWETLLKKHKKEKDACQSKLQELEELTARKRQVAYDEFQRLEKATVLILNARDMAEQDYERVKAAHHHMSGELEHVEAQLATAKGRKRRAAESNEPIKIGALREFSTFQNRPRKSPHASLSNSSEDFAPTASNRRVARRGSSIPVAAVVPLGSPRKRRKGGERVFLSREDYAQLSLLKPSSTSNMEHDSSKLPSGV
jgi:chromosome segregation ATPase